MLLLHSNKIDQAPPLRLNRLRKAFIVALSATKIGISFDSAAQKAVFFEMMHQKAFPKGVGKATLVSNIF